MSSCRRGTRTPCTPELVGVAGDASAMRLIDRGIREVPASLDAAVSACRPRRVNCDFRGSARAAENWLKIQKKGLYTHLNGVLQSSDPPAADYRTYPFRC